MSDLQLLQIVCFLGTFWLQCASTDHVMYMLDSTKVSSVLQTLTVRSRLECVSSCRPTENCVMVSLPLQSPENSFKTCLLSDTALQTMPDPKWISYKIPTSSTQSKCKSTSKSLLWTETIPNVQPLEQLDTIRQECTKTTYSFAFTQTHYYVPCYDEKKIVVIDRNTDTMEKVYSTQGKVWGAVSLPGENYVLITDPAKNTVFKVRPTSMTTFRDMSSDGASQTRGLAYQDAQIMVASYDSDNVYFLDTDTRQLLGSMATLTKPQFICVCKSGRFMITFEDINKIALYDCDRTVMWTMDFTAGRGCLCDDDDNFLVVHRTCPHIYLVANNGTSVTLYHDACNVSGYKKKNDGVIHSLYVENNKLYYLLEKGYVYVHSLQ